MDRNNFTGKSLFWIDNPAPKFIEPKIAQPDLDFIQRITAMICRNQKEYDDKVSKIS